VTATEQPGAEAAARPRPGRQYWEAQGLTDIVVPEFEAALAAGRTDQMRAAFYVLASYRARTVTIFRWAFEHGREPLAKATLRNPDRSAQRPSQDAGGSAYIGASIARAGAFGPGAADARPGREGSG
jgi:hypothetical protein